MEHTCFDISTKGIQAIGRLRNKALGVYHITNEFNSNGVNIKDIKSRVFNDALEKISVYNSVLKKFNFTNYYGTCFLDALKGVVSSFSHFNSEDNLAELDYWKIDAEIYKRISIANYNNQETVLYNWKLAGMSADDYQDTIFLSSSDKRLLKNTRVSRAEKIKLIFDKFYTDENKCQENTGKSFYERLKEHFSSGKQDLIITLIDRSEINKLIETYPMEYKWFKSIGYQRAKELRFKEASIRKASIIAHHDRIELSKDLKELIYMNFKQGHWYSLVTIKNRLSEIYSSLGLNRKITAQEIQRFFNVTDSTRGATNNRIRGFILDYKLL